MLAILTDEFNENEVADRMNEQITRKEELDALQALSEIGEPKNKWLDQLFSGFRLYVIPADRYKNYDRWYKPPIDPIPLISNHIVISPEIDRPSPETENTGT
jgi:hypothetical protein